MGASCAAELEPRRLQEVRIPWPVVPERSETAYNIRGWTRTPVARGCTPILAWPGMPEEMPALARAEGKNQDRIFHS